MDRLVLHKLPSEKGKGERGSVPNDRRVDVDGFQCGQQLTLFVVKRGQESLTSQRAAIVLVLSRPIHLPRRERGVVDTAHADDVPQLLAKRREAFANPMLCRRAARLSGRVGRKVPLVFGDRAPKIGGQAIEYLAVPYKFIDQHRLILAAGFITGCFFMDKLI